MRKLAPFLLAIGALMLCPIAASAQIIRLPNLLSRFTDNGDGTVTDNQTGLMWAKTTGQLNGVPDPEDVRNVNNPYAFCAGSSVACA
jgi:hypothetical protein